MYYNYLKKVSKPGGHLRKRSGCLAIEADSREKHFP